MTLPAPAAIPLAAVALQGAAAAAPADPTAAARSILARERCQTALPGRGSADGGFVLLGSPADRGQPPAPMTVPAEPALALVALAAVLAIVLLVRRLVPATSAAPAALAPAPRADGSGTSAAADPDALAGQGRFGEAIHALLLRALAELGRRPGSAAAAPSATSREILRHRSVHPEVQAALEPIVRSVEQVHFGRRPASADDYARCAAQYGLFRDACRASG